MPSVFSFGRLMSPDIEFRFIGETSSAPNGGSPPIADIPVKTIRKANGDERTYYAPTKTVAGKRAMKLFEHSPSGKREAKAWLRQQEAAVVGDEFVPTGRGITVAEYVGEEN